MTTNGEAYASESTLFRPLRLGRITLSNRIILAPCTRFRVDEQHTILDFVSDYYAERAAVPGTLLISEGTNLSPWATGRNRVPMIHTDQQVAAWKRVAGAVHERGCFIFMQLNAHGRVAEQAVRDSDGTGPVYSSSSIPMPVETVIGDGKLYIAPPSTPVPMTEDQIWRIVREFADAARRAVFEADFDGVEIQGANGFLIDQFTQDVCNQRTDQWGGSVENRSRFALEVTKSVIQAVGADRTGVKFSPWNTFRGMRMQEVEPQYNYLFERLKSMDLAYLHLVHPHLTGDPDLSTEPDPNESFVEKWRGSRAPIIVAGGYTAVRAKRTVDALYPDQDVAVAMGRWFIANPDLVYRMQKDIPLNPYRRQLFYGPPTREGYLDYPVSEEWVKGQLGVPDGPVNRWTKT